MATYISAKGESIEVAPHTLPFFSTLELEQLLEGHPAFLHLDDGSLLIYNDIYYEIGVEKNEVATSLALDTIPENAWIAGPAVHLTHRDYAKKHLEAAARDSLQPLVGTFQLYMIRFEACDEVGKYLYDNVFVVYARDEVELHMRIADIATTKAKYQKLLAVEKRSHGLTTMHEHLPATIVMPEESRTDGK